MIHIVSGTKAQLIKMFPVMHLLQEEGIDYNFIDIGQHSETTAKLREQFGVKDPDIVIVKPSKNISSNFRGIVWIFKVLFSSIFRLKKIFKGDKKGLCMLCLFLFH